MVIFTKGTNVNTGVVPLNTKMASVVFGMFENI